MENAPDLSKVISTIIQNPELMSMIKGMSQKIDTEEAKEASAKPQEPVDTEDEALAEEVTARPESDLSVKRKRRHDLLCAIKPYVSKSRSRAIDTMLSLSDVLEVIKGG